MSPGTPTPPPPEGPAIEALGLSAWFGTTPALREISLAIPRRRVTALIGPSGSGKSTLLRCFNRLNDLTPGFRLEGKLLLEGAEVDGRGGVPVATLRRRVGMVFQRPNPFPKSIYDNVAWGVRIHGYSGDVDQRVEQALRDAALWDEVKDRLHASALSLSGGQQQRLCIARSLAVEPSILLLDEPCAALDPSAASRIEELLDELREDYTIVVVTHNLPQAKRVSQWTACLMPEDPDLPAPAPRPGVLIEFSPTEVLFTNPRDRRTEDYITGRIG